MNGTIFNQILATLMMSFIFVGFTVAAVLSKDIVAIIGSIITGILTILIALNSIQIIKKEKGIKVKKNFNYGIIICFIFILILFGSFLASLIISISNRINSVQTMAIIYDMNKEIKYVTEYDKDGNSYEKKKTVCESYIKYNAEDEEYKTKINVGCKYSIGDKVKIYYNKDDPSELFMDSIVLLSVGTLISGIVLIIYIVKWVKS